MFSQVIYLFVPVPPVEGSADVSSAFPFALGFVALVQSVGIVGLLKIRAVNPIQAGTLDPETKEGLARLFNALIVSWVLAESVAIYGLVLRFMHFDLIYVVPFVAAGAFLLFLGRPWQSKLKKPLSSADLARSSAPIS